MPQEWQDALMTHTSLRVLIVDDNKDGADSLLLVLQAYGLQPRAAYDGESGLRLAREFQPDVVLLDIGMPGLTATRWPAGSGRRRGCTTPCSSLSPAGAGRRTAAARPMPGSTPTWSSPPTWLI